MAKEPAPKGAPKRKPSTRKPAATKAAGARTRTPKRSGRPSVYSEALGQRICDLMEQGLSLRTIEVMPDMPSRYTMMRWLNDPEKPDLQVMAGYAREARADRLADEILSIADDGSNDTYTDEDGNQKVDYDVIARSRLRVDARKWYASKLAPKKYGDKLTNEHTGANGSAIEVHSTVTFVKAPVRSDDE